MTSAEATDPGYPKFSQISVDSFIHFCQIFLTTAPQNCPARIPQMPRTFSHGCPSLKEALEKTFSESVAMGDLGKEVSVNYPSMAKD